MNPWKLRRLEAGETLTAFAERAGLSPKTVRDFENGVQGQNAKTLHALAGAHAVTVAALLGITDDQEAA